MIRSLPVFALLFSCLMTGKLWAQQTNIRGFTDITFTASDNKAEKATFALGQYDLYITSDPTDRISFLGETVFEYDDGFIVDVERVVLRYNVNNHLNVELGKHHTPIGYWNTAYHHGSVLQPTITRPLMFLFEDEGGILPIHTTGAAAWGTLLNALDYNLMIGNGIGSDPVSDNNNAKSFSLALEGEIREGLYVGVTGYLDSIAEGTPSLQGDEETPVLLAHDVRQRMVGGNVRYQKRPLEIIAEFLNVSNETALTTTSTTAYYVYAGYSLGDLTPYLRYDDIRFEEDEPYYVPEDVHQLLLGVRYDFSYITTIKLEYQRLEQHGQQTNRLVFQFAIGF